MSILFTAIAILKDWKMLRQRNREVLIGQVQQAGATHYQIYRNIHNASQVLIVAELPDDHALRELRQALSEHIGTLLEGSRADERMWESTGWDEVW